MCRRLLLAVLLVVASPCVFAQASAGGTANEGNGAGAEAETTGNPARRGNPASDKRGPAPVRSEPARNTQPRWHSFLPGMFR